MNQMNLVGEKLPTIPTEIYGIPVNPLLTEKNSKYCATIVGYVNQRIPTNINEVGIL